MQPFLFNTVPHLQGGPGSALTLAHGHFVHVFVARAGNRPAPQPLRAALERIRLP